MRPDKKKKNRGKLAEKSEDAQTQSKNAVSSKVPEKEEAVSKTSAGDTSEKSQVENVDKGKSTAKTPAANEASTENLPPPNLRRETDALKEPKKPSKRQIFSDWKEYDQPIHPEEIEEEQLRDFTSLIQQNITEDNYFKFKHERQWENDSCNINKDLFNLNLQELSAGLQCIPFYKRLNISADLFSANEVKRMDNYAKEQEKVYETILNEQDSVPVYHVLEKLIKEPDIQPVAKPSKGAEKDEISEISMISTENLLLGNELVKCIADEKQDISHETSLMQEKESKSESINLDFFNCDNKPKVHDEIMKNVNEDNKQLIKKEDDRKPETAISGVSPPEDEVKHEIKETESMVKLSEPSPIEADSTESSAMDMAAVFESAPLGQRKKPQRSREAKAKNKPKVESTQEDEQVLDSLLSLKEPAIVADDSKSKEMEEVEKEADDLTNDLKSIVIHDKKENLEAWLDSMLDD
ncbi:uncharacterized protein LOC124153496 [Ischnura elegans]|uniref:uncharacterized protein LOC124153496 n=1 Tax=Ischnura elegans TaxID=197161 RepID=UPI001ED88532|nr:uncharacterized protein LOC124153496 [Ischnura elegans]